MFVFWRQRNSVLQETFRALVDHLNLMGGDRPELIAAGIATADFVLFTARPPFSLRRAHPLRKNIYF
jgi:hypothetical protein